MAIKCAHCKGRHERVAQVLLCSKNRLSTPTPEPAPIDPNACAGGVCKSVDELCSKHSWQYQRRWGRAANE